MIRLAFDISLSFAIALATTILHTAGIARADAHAEIAARTARAMPAV